MAKVEKKAKAVEENAEESAVPSVQAEDQAPDQDHRNNQETADTADETTEDSNDDSEVQGHLTKAGKHSAKAKREAEEEAARKAAIGTKPAEKLKPPAPKRNPLKHHGKAYRAAAAKVDRTKQYELTEALALVKDTATTKFDSSIELHLNLGVDPRQADQMVRSTVVLPAGTGKSLRIAVVASSDKHAEAKKAGANLIGDTDLIAKIEKGKLDFDVLIATPDMMASLGKAAKILGPRGLMPNPKSGTVTPNVAQAIEQAKAGKIEFRIDKQAIVHMLVGKASFDADKLLGNATTAIDAVMKAKPAAAKGTYVQAMTLTSSMGPGIKLDVQAAIAAANPKR
ncbi:MAG TPA: 50S ribosomal protein L1 [Candidatus Polarisedimenticolaceae bacterium]|nr:50S ribosomal protein L1 [Candidatus Polarisedimenticolaceae bacterium]